jgi:hypothetical protein
MIKTDYRVQPEPSTIVLGASFFRILSFSQNHLSGDGRDPGESQCPGLSAAAAWATIRELPL